MTSSPKGRQEAAVLDAKPDLIGRLTAFADITPGTTSGFSRLNPAARSLIREAAKALSAPAKPDVEVVEARTEDEWHEDDGYAVWWTWRDGDWLGEPSYIGSPLCEDWPGYHTHWTPHPAFPSALQAPATPEAQTEVEK